MQLIEQLRSGWLYALSCYSSDYASPDCKPYWNWVAYGAFALAGLIIILVGWSLYREHSAYWRGRLHFRAAVTTGADNDPHGFESPEIAEKFQRALESRKAALRNSGPVPPAKQ